MDMTIFEAFLVSRGGVRADGLSRGSGTPLEKVFEFVGDEVTSKLGVLDPNRRYTTKQLCLPDLWAALPLPSQRRSAGMCLKFLVAAGALPLVLHKTKSGKGPKRYCLPR